MAVRTVWPVGHDCGHQQDHDLSQRRPSERAGYARWLAGRDCTACWQAKREKGREKERAAWVAEQREEENRRVAAWEERTAMPELAGSDKAVAWARRVRYELVVAGHDHAGSVGVTDDDFALQVEQPARKITSASWWIDQKDTAGEDVAEVVPDAATHGIGVGVGVENPY